MLRLGNCRLRRAPRSTGTPPRLLPTPQRVLQAADRAQLAAWLAPLPVSDVAQVRQPRCTHTASRDIFAVRCSAAASSHAQHSWADSLIAHSFPPVEDPTPYCEHRCIGECGPD